MSKDLPYMPSPGTLPKILEKIVDASVPESFNADFLGTKLGFKGGNQRIFISWAKKVGLLNPDGTPTLIYKNFRNPDFRGSAMAKALKIGYEELYSRNEYAHDLSDKDLKKLISEITGKAHDNGTVRAIYNTFKNAKKFAEFDKEPIIQNETIAKAKKEEPKKTSSKNDTSESANVKLGLNYTINLVLPKTDDPAIFDAIFTSLKQNLLNE